MGRRKEYVRRMRLFTPEQEATFEELYARWGAPSINAVMRACLDLGIAVALKLPIDKRGSHGIVEKTEDDRGG